MSEALANLINRASPEAFFGIVITIGGAFLVAIIAIIVSHWYQWRKRELESALKHEMLARGMTADDIERVLAAGYSSTGFRCSRTEYPTSADTIDGIKRT
jgi:hypothetical protein